METRGRAPRTHLVRLRQNAGLSQAQLAAALGLASPRAVKAWESGAYAPSISYALPLARILRVPVEEVVEAVAGPDPGADSALASSPPTPLEELAHHLAEATRLVRQLEAQARAGTDEPDAGADQPASPSGPETRQESRTSGR